MSSDRLKGPVETYEAAALDAAFTQLLLQEAEALLAQEPTPEEALLLAQLEERLPQQLKHLERIVRRRDRRQRTRSAVRSFLSISATLLAVVLISLSTAIAASVPIRQRFISFLTRTTSEYIEVGFTRNTELPGIPEGWLGDYFPTYLPEGYELTFVDSTPVASRAMFTRDDRTIVLDVCSATQKSRIDARNAEIRTLRINDHEATLVSKDDLHVVILPWDIVYFTVTASDSDTAIDVAASIAPIPREILDIVYTR